MTFKIFLCGNNLRSCSAASPFQSHLQIFPARNIPPAMDLEICRKGSNFTWQKLRSTQLLWAKLLTLSPRLSRIDVLMLFSFGNKILSLPCRYLFSLYSSIVTEIQFKMFKTPNSSKGSGKLHLTQHCQNKQDLIYFRSGVFLHSH